MNTTRTSTPENELTLFVGCLDPSTSQAEFEGYFLRLDPALSAKLILEFSTNRSKQCGLLFCSSVETRDRILSTEHVLQGRILRVSLAQAERKGKKTGQTYPVQVSGLDPNCTLEQLQEAFAQFSGLVGIRFVQGIHPKQKKVAILTFDNPDSPKCILSDTHFKIGSRNCKVAEYIQKGQMFPKLSQSCPYGSPQQLDQSMMSQSQLSSSSQPWLLGTLTQGSPLAMSRVVASPAIGPAQTTPAMQKKGLSKLSLGCPFLPSSQTHSHTLAAKTPASYVLPVEVEEDSLFRIFCQTEQQRPRADKLRLSEASAETTED